MKLLLSIRISPYFTQKETGRWNCTKYFTSNNQWLDTKSWHMLQPARKLQLIIPQLKYRENWEILPTLQNNLLTHNEFLS